MIYALYDKKYKTWATKAGGHAKCLDNAKIWTDIQSISRIVNMLKKNYPKAGKNCAIYSISIVSSTVPSFGRHFSFFTKRRPVPTA